MEWTLGKYERKAYFWNELSVSFINGQKFFKIFVLLVVESGCLLKKHKKHQNKERARIKKNEESTPESSSESISSCNVAKKRKIEEKLSSENSFSDNNDSILEDISRQLIEYKFFY